MTYIQLTETERYPISSLKKAGFSQRFIAAKPVDHQQRIEEKSRSSNLLP
ncbi:hypothetical protein Ppb6_03340 [Photorhabdus australis subsp. thailandensis]|uniref:Uncharacterized protein n=1 Tax=Photorhabdus australis subsp. thailandensis TaxID=2805096 RepID=A0A1C0U0N7_9GAMM|nr:hypothetical protein Ppb6_03340 [Photorhabdus australis subsp. thailandensis]